VLDMKRFVLSLTVSGILVLGLASGAAARSGIGLADLNSEMYPDTAVAASAIDVTSQLSLRLRFLDAVLYPDVVDAGSTAPTGDLFLFCNCLD
jgi:hypothetical protein